MSEWRPKQSKLSYSAAYNAFKKFLLKCGLDSKKFALHSPRIGGTITLFQNNIPKRIIDKQGRWKSRNTKYRYARDDKSYLISKLAKQHM